MYDYGFIVGKFMPLHKGHEFLINTALKQCRKLIILSYHSEVLGGANRLLRKTWLETAFPSANITVYDNLDFGTDGTGDRDFCASFLYNKLVIDWDMCDTSTLAVFSSEDYGHKLAEVILEKLPIKDVLSWVVDRNRTEVPTSGTQMRANPDPEFISPFVYNKRAVILGGESSGKTTLVKELSNYYHEVYEYGREWWDKSEKTMADLMHIADVQVGMENERVLRRINPNVLICDTSPLTTAFYAKELFGYIPERLKHLAKRGYNHYILLKRHFDHVQDGSRRDQAFSDKAFEFYRSYLEVNKLPYLLIDSGTPEENAIKVMNYVKT